MNTCAEGRSFARRSRTRRSAWRSWPDGATRVERCLCRNGREEVTGRMKLRRSSTERTTAHDVATQEGGEVDGFCWDAGASVGLAVRAGRRPCRRAARGEQVLDISGARAVESQLDCRPTTTHSGLRPGRVLQRLRELSLPIRARTSRSFVDLDTQGLNLNLGPAPETIWLEVVADGCGVCSAGE